MGGGGIGAGIGAIVGTSFGFGRIGGGATLSGTVRTIGAVGGGGIGGGSVGTGRIGGGSGDGDIGVCTYCCRDVGGGGVGALAHPGAPRASANADETTIAGVFGIGLTRGPPERCGRGRFGLAMVHERLSENRATR